MAGILQSFMSGVANLLSAPPADTPIHEAIASASNSNSSSETSATVPDLELQREVRTAIDNHRLTNEIAVMTNFNNPPTVSTRSADILRPKISLRAQATPSQTAAMDMPLMNFGLEFIPSSATSTSALGYGAQSASSGRAGGMNAMLSLRLPFSVHVGSTSAANHPGFFTVVTKRAQKAHLLRAQQAEAAAADIPRYNSAAPPLLLEDELPATQPTQEDGILPTVGSSPLASGLEPALPQLPERLPRETPSAGTATTAAADDSRRSRAIFQDFSKAAVNTSEAKTKITAPGHALVGLAAKPTLAPKERVNEEVSTASQAHFLEDKEAHVPANRSTKAAVEQFVPPNPVSAKRSRATFEAAGKHTDADKGRAKRAVAQPRPMIDAPASRQIFEIQGTGKWIFGPKHAQKAPPNLSSDYTRMCGILYWPSKASSPTVGAITSIPNELMHEAIAFTMSVDEVHLANYCKSNVGGPSFLFQTWEVKAVVTALLWAAVPSASWEWEFEKRGINFVETAPTLASSQPQTLMRRRTPMQLLAALQHVNEYFAGNLFESCREIRRVAAAKALGYDVSWTFAGDWINDFSIEVLILEGSLIVEKLLEAPAVRWKWMPADGSLNKTQPIIGFYSSLGLCMQVFTSGRSLLPGQKLEKHGPACKPRKLRGARAAGAAPLLLIDKC